MSAADLGRVVGAVLAVVMCVAIPYGVAAITFLEPNPAGWEEPVRFMWIVSGMGLVVWWKYAAK